MTMEQQRGYIKDALGLLGIKRLALAIHDQSFPSHADEEVGRGSPYSYGGTEFMRFAAQLGFNCLQLGPQGKTSRSNPSPYDSSIFSKNETSISLLRLAQDPSWHNLLDANFVKDGCRWNGQSAGTRSLHSYRFAYDTVRKAVAIAFENFSKDASAYLQLSENFERWRKANRSWLDNELLFEALTLEYGTDDWRQWDEMDGNLAQLDDEHAQQRKNWLIVKHARQLRLFEFAQFVVHIQHAHFKKDAGDFGLKLFGDVQIGFAPRDYWAFRQLFLPGYLLGAPPSRTNPDGQPWGYPLLDPDLYFANGTSNPGRALQFFEQRIDKLIADFDGLRIDHPHGIVCPWVYDATATSALRAVQNGARLFESPHMKEHPRLAHYAIVRPDQLDESVPPYADGWVKNLDERQIEKYAVLINTVERRMHLQGRDTSDLICEVLSSCPFPLKTVLAFKGLGRFRVTQKADPTNKDDVYRTDTAAPPDWVMLGTHDTPTVWSAVAAYDADKRSQWANYLAQRLESDATSRSATARLLSENPRRLAAAMFADLFLGPAQNVSVFFADLFGMTESYNRPGIVSDENWVLSLQPDYKAAYAANLCSGCALSLPSALATALKSRARVSEGDSLQLAQKLEMLAVNF